MSTYSHPFVLVHLVIRRVLLQGEEKNYIYTSISPAIEKRQKNAYCMDLGLLVQF